MDCGVSGDRGLGLMSAVMGAPPTPGQPFWSSSPCSPGSHVGSEGHGAGGWGQAQPPRVSSKQDLSPPACL